MPLLDHFHPPLRSIRHWESFHARWAVALADMLNDNLLPKDYVAEVQAHVGSRVEIDVATFGEETTGITTAGTTATATLAAPAWAPPAATWQMPAIFPDSIQVLVMSLEAGPTLAAAVELVSPGNKDRPETWRAFAAKCAAYLQQGIGLVVLDIVTERRGNLHNELADVMGVGEGFRMPADSSLYAVAYRPVRREDVERIDVWPTTLALGHPLPLVPLALGTRWCVPLDVDAAYMEACRRTRIV